MRCFFMSEVSLYREKRRIRCEQQVCLLLALFELSWAHHTMHLDAGCRCIRTGDPGSCREIRGSATRNGLNPGKYFSFRIWQPKLLHRCSILLVRQKSVLIFIARTEIRHDSLLKYDMIRSRDSETGRDRERIVRERQMPDQQMHD